MLLRIRTNDDVVVEVGSEDLMVSNLIRMLVEGVEECDEIPLHNVSYSSLKKVIEFTRHHRKDPMTAIGKPLINNEIPVQKWYLDYVSGEPEKSLYEVLEAASYMDIEPLQELVCARIASLIQGKECDELKKIFGIEY